VTCGHPDPSNLCCQCNNLVSRHDVPARLCGGPQYGPLCSSSTDFGWSASIECERPWV